LTKELQNRDYQDRIVQKTIEHFQNEIPSVGIVSPTGSGKTIMGMRFLKWLDENHPHLTVNWVAMRRQLLRQAAHENNEMFGLKNVNFVSMFDSNPPKSDIIVIDELQHSSTESFNHVSNWDVKFILGMSATPFRTDKLKLPFNRMIQDAGIHRLIQEGWLSKYQHWCMEEYTPESVAKCYIEDQDRWGKSVVFFHQIKQCEEFQNILAQNGIRCEVVTGASTNAHREEQLDKFDDGEYKVVANVAILTEGYDCPDLQTVFCRDSAKLPTIQMAGRGFRICEGKTHVNIVQSKVTKWQFTKTAKPEKSWVQKSGQWYSLGSNKAVNTTVKSMYHKLVDIDVEMPTFIIKNRAKKRVFKQGFGA
jgi:superfamily II DNA or RNA helicase